MRPLRGLISKNKSPSKDASRILSKLARDTKLLRLEIEGSQVRFYSILSVKRGMVIVARPDGIASRLKSGSIVRFDVPGDENVQIRMEVTAPTFNLTNGNSVFLCKIPTVVSEGSGRSSERFNTSRFNNLLLEFKSSEIQKLRIIDLAAGGCKFHCAGLSAKALFPLGKSISDVQIQLGTRITVDLEFITPRAHMGPSVGAEFNISAVENHAKFFQHLLISLDKADSERHKSATM